MDTLESKLRIAHQIQVAALEKGMACSVMAYPGHFYIAVHFVNDLVEMIFDNEATEQELLDWWEAIAK